MKKLILGFVLLISFSGYCQQLTLGDQLPEIMIDLPGTDEEVLNSTQLKGKVVLIDFWATYCSPCVKGLSHLESLQREFGDKLRVIGVSHNSKERLERFLSKKSYDFTFALGNDQLEGLFPHRSIPHSILIDDLGKIIAITSPENITEEVIRQVLAHQVIDLPLKQDNMSFDSSHDYFEVDSTTRETFVLLPYMSSVPSFSKFYGNGIFKDRRMTTYNTNYEGLFRMVYDLTAYRVISEVDESIMDWDNEQNRYCMDVIVENPEDLYSYAQSQLEQSVPVKVRREVRDMDVLVVMKLKGGIKASATTVEGNLTAGGSGFSNTGATIKEFCDYLEGFGIVGMPVVDETGEEGLFDIQFAFDPEDPETFKQAIADLGLAYEKAEREIEVLILYEEDSN